MDREMNSNSEKKRRYDKYLALIEGQDEIALEYLAGATGLGAATVENDVRNMASKGYFGNSAYVNYRTKTLVLKNGQVQRTEKAGTVGNTPHFTLTQELVKPKLQTLLFWGGILLVILGASYLGDALDTASTAGMTSAAIWGFVRCTCYIGGGGACLAVRDYQKVRFERCKKICAVLPSSGTVSVSDLSASSGFSADNVQSVVLYLMRKNVIGGRAQFDKKTGVLYLEGFPCQEEKKEAPAEKENDGSYAGILREIHRLNDGIRDEQVSKRIAEIEDLTGKIFRVVEEKPEKKSQIRMFMNYYLPTTLKLLRSYSLLEKQGVDGDNIGSARQSIEGILEKLSNGYREQLDQLFREEVIDISTDIDVLETMMKRDGLAGGPSGFAAEAEQTTGQSSTGV